MKAPMLSATTVPAPVGLMAMILVAQMSLGSRGDSQANQIQAEPTRNRQRAARRQGERRVTRRQLQGAARTARFRSRGRTNAATAHARGATNEYGTRARALGSSSQP